MTPPSRSRALVPVVALALAACLAPPTEADRLYLENGRHLDVTRWWIEGDSLFYEAAAGTVGIPRSIVVRIDRGKPSGHSAPRPASAAAVGRRTGQDDAEVREVLRQAQQALESREFERASSSFLRLLQQRPELYAARVGYAVSEIEMGRDGSALSVILDGIRREPDRAELYVLLGELRYRDERLEDALEAWRRAFDLEPTDVLRDRILKAERELHTSRHYDLASSSHFTLRYDGTVDLELASSVMDYLEEQYWVVTQTYRHAPPQPITVQLFPQRAFQEITQAPDWAAGLYDGKIRVPLGGLTRLTPDAKRVLVHELTHAVIHSKSRGSAPRWLQEGLAQMAEGKNVLRRERQALVAALEGTPPDGWSRLEFSYPLALSQCQFLASRSGFATLVDLVDRLGQGLEVDDALREIYGQDYAAISRDWGRALVEDR